MPAMPPVSSGGLSMGDEKPKPLAPPNNKLPSLLLKPQSTWNEHHLLSAARAKEVREEIAAKTDPPTESDNIDTDRLGNKWGWWGGKRR